MLTLPQRQKLKELKKKHGYEISQTPAMQGFDDYDLLVTLSIVELDTALSKNINEVNNILGDSAVEDVIIPVLAKTYRQLQDIYGKKRTELITRIFDTVLHMRSDDE